MCCSAPCCRTRIHNPVINPRNVMLFDAQDWPSARSLPVLDLLIAFRLEPRLLEFLQARLQRHFALQNLHDAVHHHMYFRPETIAVMDTPQVQRLRDVKQLSMASYVYPSAQHRRHAPLPCLLAVTACS